MAADNTIPGNPDQIAYWNGEAGATWARLQERLDRQIEPLGALAMQALSPAPGERIFDIGCGCGQTSLELAKIAGAAGRVVGIDVSAPMLAFAERRAAEAGIKNLRFLQADAQVFDFEPASADAVFSRFGVMFFADPTAAFANIRTALRPGGRLAFVCWRDVALNPFMTLPFAAAAPLLPEQPAPADPLAPGPFAFADGDRLRAILAGAGFGDIALVAHDQAIGAGNLEKSSEVALSIGPLGRALRETPQKGQAVREAVRAALAPHLTADGVMLASASWIVTAANPRRIQP
jgi:SAM-dependent methyltransferase